MGIDWYWIKQRPQFIAELLSKDYDISVVYQKEIVKKIELRKNRDELKNSLALPILPYRDKSFIVHTIQRFIFEQRIKNIHEFDMIWIGHPLLYRYVPSSFQGKIIYDCMDNHIALCTDLKIKEVICKSEEELIGRADLIFVSSMNLKKRIETKYQYMNAVLIRNGEEIFRGAIDQLKRFKDDVKEVAQGFECGISFSKFNDIQEGDIIEVSTTEEVERKSL